VIRIETEGDVERSRCERCAGSNHVLHGYVYEDDLAEGVYFVEWCDGHHPTRAAFLTLGLGPFAEGTTSADRRAFGVEWRAAGMALTDEPVIDEPDALGRFVPRAEALEMDDLDHLWHVVDHIVLEDPRLPAVQQWLAEEGSS
jgi:hypothetical protein